MQAQNKRSKLAYLSSASLHSFFMAAPNNLKQIFLHGFEEYWNYMIQSFQNPNLYNPLIYLVLVFAVTFLSELLLPKLLPYPTIKRKGFWQDFIYVIFMDYLIEVIGIYALACCIEYITLGLFHKLHIQTPLANLNTLPTPLRFIVFFLLIDFLQWLAHFGLHRSNFFWQFHKIHHAQETLGFASTRHFHFGEYLLLKPATWIPFALCGFKVGNYVIWYLWIGYFLTFLSHCNINIKWGFLKYIFITPETHFWHHSKNIPGKYGVNYASSLVIWDLLFGHFYNPKDKKPILGIPENDIPYGIVGQMTYPFKSLFNLKPDVDQNKDYLNTIKNQNSISDKSRSLKKK